MDCIIIDDEKMARAIIAKLCRSVNVNLNVVAEFSNAIEAIKYLNQSEVDLIFLDIHMPGFTGFDFIETIKNPPKVILTTSDSTFAIRAFEYDCIVDYLVKPINLERFEKSLQKATKALRTKTPEKLPSPNTAEVEEVLYVNIDRRLVKIDIPSIYLVEAMGDYISVKTENKSYVVHSTLKKIEEKLPTDLFLKIHRSYIINVDKIINIEDNSVLIKQEVIPVSRSNRPELMRRLNLL